MIDMMPNIIPNTPTILEDIKGCEDLDPVIPTGIVKFIPFPVNESNPNIIPRIARINPMRS